MIRILTDTSSDFTLEEAKQLNITLLPMTISFGEESFKDRFELSVDKFYERLVSNDTLPTTSQVPPFDFEAEYKKAKEAGDDVIVITLSHELSGTYQNAAIAADEFENVYVIDSLQVTLPQQCLLREAAKLRDEGKSAKEIYETLLELKKRVRVVALLDTLEYLKKGGRISPTTAWAGALLNIKPVVTVEEGKVVIAGKARGSKCATNMLNELIEKYGGIDKSLPIVIGYSGLNDALLTQYIEDCKYLIDNETDLLIRSRIGSTIGTHVGPGAIAIGFFSKN
jgi:DegV family protein with EDD domain